MAIRNRIKELVDSRGISVYRFWKDTGVGQNTAYDLYRHPERYPMAEVMDAICRAYGVTPGDVLEYIPDNGPEAISDSGPEAVDLAEGEGGAYEQEARLDSHPNSRHRDRSRSVYRVGEGSGEVWVLSRCGRHRGHKGSRFPLGG